MWSRTYPHTSSLMMIGMSTLYAIFFRSSSSSPMVPVTTRGLPAPGRRAWTVVPALAWLTVVPTLARLEEADVVLQELLVGLPLRRGELLDADLEGLGEGLGLVLDRGHDDLGVVVV